MLMCSTLGSYVVLDGILIIGEGRKLRPLLQSDPNAETAPGCKPDLTWATVFFPLGPSRAMCAEPYPEPGLRSHFMTEELTCPS